MIPTPLGFFEMERQLVGSLRERGVEVVIAPA